MREQPPTEQRVRRRRWRMPRTIGGRSWSALAQTLVPVVALSALAVFATLHFVRGAPPRTLTITAGPPGSAFETAALRYQAILAKSGVTLKVLQSQGSLDNLARLSGPTPGIDIGLVQSGVAGDTDPTALMSLGSVFYEPLLIFYRSARPIERLSELHGKRIGIGADGSGARYLALALLKANEIEPGGTSELLPIEGEAAKQALLSGSADAIFVAGDSASPATIRALLHESGVRVFDFAQADGYVRRFPYLSKLEVPAGAFDLGENLPPSASHLLAPTVELLARPDLHPALSDLLIEAAIKVHGRAALLQDAGQFPAPIAHDFALSADAARYYKSGKTFTYRYLPFWLASLLNRTLAVVVPLLLVAIPGLRFLPELFNWRVRRRIHHRYVQLMALERHASRNPDEAQRAALLSRLDEIERSVIAVRVPGSHANQLYVLRQHIRFVRDGLTGNDTGGTVADAGT